MGAVIGGAVRSPSSAVPLGATRVLTISFALHFAALAWVLPSRPPPVVEVFAPEAPVEMVMAPEVPPAAEAAEPATEPEARTVPPATAEAAAEPAPVEGPVPIAGAPEPPLVAVTPAPPAARRPIQPRAVATVVPRPTRPAPAPVTDGFGGGGIGAVRAAAPPVLPADYVAAVQAVLARGRRYPPEARARGAEGTAWVRFTIRRDGVVVAANVARSSGDASLDAATEDTAARSVMPPLPDSWTAPTMTLVVPVSYALR